MESRKFLGEAVEKHVECVKVYKYKNGYLIVEKSGGEFEISKSNFKLIYNFKK